MHTPRESSRTPMGTAIPNDSFFAVLEEGGAAGAAEQA